MCSVVFQHFFRGCESDACPFQPCWWLHSLKPDVYQKRWTSTRGKDFLKLLTHPACLRLGLKNSLKHFLCLGYGFSPSERLDNIVCLVLSSSLVYIYITIFGAGRKERCCCSVIPHSDVTIFLFLEMRLSFIWQAEVLCTIFVIHIKPSQYWKWC